MADAGRGQDSTFSALGTRPLPLDRPRRHVQPREHWPRVVAWLSVLALHVLFMQTLRIEGRWRPPEAARAQPRIEITLISEQPIVPGVAPPVPAQAATIRPVREARESTPAKAVRDSDDVPASPRIYTDDGAIALPVDLLGSIDRAVAERVEFRIADLDKSGMFLRPAPIDYVPTRFDGFWLPQETLLEEWVRKGVAEVSIPIPGSSWRIVCKVSVLAVGGACGIAPVVQDTNAPALAPYVPPPNRNLLRDR